mmetsp:Transcript_3647/g.7024  ORF Transcript_3647/g.7024 Transcript_3647/m.7024 type:complete len:105 (+) Transcript_3647:32-346(+)
MGFPGGHGELEQAAWHAPQVRVAGRIPKRNSSGSLECPGTLPPPRPSPKPNQGHAEQKVPATCATRFPPTQPNGLHGFPHAGDAPSPAGFISTTSMNFMLPGTS